MQRIQGQAEAGNTVVTTVGTGSTNVVEGSFPGATISVFLTGTNNLAAIFGDNGVTPKANPFTAASDGSWFFYVANGHYDVTIAGTVGGVTVNRTIGDILADDPAIQTLELLTVPFSATPTFNLNSADWFFITMTGDVTGPTFTNAGAGSVLYLTIMQDGAGNHLWTWPVSFLNPPTISAAASSSNDFIFGFDGVNWRHLASGATADFLTVTTGTLLVTGAAQVNGSITGGTTINAVTGFRVNGLAAANTFLKGNGTNYVSGSPILNSADFANQGTATQVLHGNAAGNPSWAGVSLVNDTAANQGTVHTVLHGNAAGQPSFGAVTIADADTSIAPTGADINTSGQVVSTHLAAALPRNQGGTGYTTGVNYSSADQIVYLSVGGNDSNDGLTPGTAKLTAQAAFNTATASGTVSGTVLVAAGSYTGPATWYSNLTVRSTSPQYTAQLASQFGLANNLGGVKFTYAANLTWTLLTNVCIEGIELAFANSGGGLILNSVSVSRFLHSSVTLAGSSTQAAVQMKTNNIAGVANNTVRNYFEDFVIIGNNSGAGNQADGLTLAGSGGVGTGTFVTDNTFVNLTVAGGLKNGIRFELNSDTNHFFGVYLNEDVPGAGVGYALAFNLTTPASDQDANGMVLMGVESTGSFTGSIQMGQCSGSHIQMTGGAEIVPNVTGGTPTYVLETIMLNGGAPVFNANGILKGANLKATTGVGGTGSTGLQHGRVSTGSIAGSSRAAVTLTWPVAFANTNYTAVVSVQEATAAPGLSLRIEHIQTINAGSIVVSLVNDNAGALTGVLHGIAMHD